MELRRDTPVRTQELGKYSPHSINSIETLHGLNLDEVAGAGLSLLLWVINFTSGDSCKFATEERLRVWCPISRYTLRTVSAIIQCISEFDRSSLKLPSTVEALMM